MAQTNYHIETSKSGRICLVPMRNRYYLKCLFRLKWHYAMKRIQGATNELKG